MSTIKKVIYLTLAFIFLIIGSIGVILPVLPTTPFLLLASVFFAHGSEKFYNWFISTKLYKENLDSFFKSRSMTIKAKARILILATIMLLTAFYFVNYNYLRGIIVIVILCKYYYFGVKIKTIPQEINHQDIKSFDGIKTNRQK